MAMAFKQSEQPQPTHGTERWHFIERCQQFSTDRKKYRSESAVY